MRDSSSWHRGIQLIKHQCIYSLRNQDQCPLTRKSLVDAGFPDNTRCRRHSQCSRSLQNHRTTERAGLRYRPALVTRQCPLTRSPVDAGARVTAASEPTDSESLAEWQQLQYRLSSAEGNVHRSNLRFHIIDQAVEAFTTIQQAIACCP